MIEHNDTEERPSGTVEEARQVLMRDLVVRRERNAAIDAFEQAVREEASAPLSVASSTASGWLRRAEVAEALNAHLQARVAELEAEAAVERENYQSLGQNWHEAEERLEAFTIAAREIVAAKDTLTRIAREGGMNGALAASERLTAADEALRALVEPAAAPKGGTK